MDAAYILRQLEDFRSGARSSSVPGLLPQSAMVRVAQQATPAEFASAAAYFAALPRRSAVAVVEAARVPRTTALGFMRVPVAGGGTEVARPAISCAS